MTQRHAQIAEQKVESAFSSVRIVADQTCHTQAIAEAAIAEARSVCDEVLSRIAAFAKCADDSTSSAVGILRVEWKKSPHKQRRKRHALLHKSRSNWKRNWKPL